MNSIIQNSQWYAQADGNRAYFESTGPITYDNCCIQNYRTCSISLTEEDAYAQDLYTPLLPLTCQNYITFGYRIRAIEATKVDLVVTFFDKEKQILGTKSKCINDQLSYEFQDISKQFFLPYEASYIQLSIAFTGPITACTFFAPFAIFQ